MKFRHCPGPIFIPKVFLAGLFSSGKLASDKYSVVGAIITTGKKTIPSLFNAGGYRKEKLSEE